jgi:hypothetical protein
VKPEEIEFDGLFASGQPDLAERMEDIIYGSEMSEDA